MSDDKPKPDVAGNSENASAGTASAGEVAEQALDKTQQAADQVQQAAEDGSPLEYPGFEAGDNTSGANGINFLADVDLSVKVELGRTLMYVEDVLRLGEGSVVELDKPAGDPVDIYVNNRRVARGEVLVVNDNLCVRVSEIIDEAVDQS